MNLRALRLISGETFVLLRRDRLFGPAAGMMLVVAIVAVLVSDWSIEDFTKILYDVGVFGFQMTGSLVALTWGTKVVSDSRQEGALEVQLAAPVSRATWLVGKYIGLSLCLLLLLGLLLVVWQACLLLNQFGWLTLPQLSMFGFMALGWLVLAALALMLGTMARQGTAFLAAVGLWIGGLATSLVASSLAPETPAAVRSVVNALARFWDFQQFNLVDHALDSALLSTRKLAPARAMGQS